MAMQISLEEIITMLLSRVETLAMNDENNKTKFNIIARILYTKGIITDDDVLEAIRAEHKMLRELGMIPKEPGEDVVKMSAESILQWIRGDVEGIKKSMEEYEKKLRELSREEAKKPSIAVASAGALQQLDRMAPPPGGKTGKSKLII